MGDHLVEDVSGSLPAVPRAALSRMEAVSENETNGNEITDKAGWKSSEMAWLWHQRQLHERDPAQETSKG